MFCLMLIASLRADVRSLSVLVSISLCGVEEWERSEKADSMIDSRVSEERANLEISV